MFNSKLLVACLIVSTSFGAKAGYHKCYGKKVTVIFAQAPQGLMLSAKRAGAEAGNVFYGMVDIENVIFDGTGLGMQNVKVVAAADAFGSKVAALNLGLKSFFVQNEKTNEYLVQEDDLTCDYSAGE